MKHITLQLRGLLLVALMLVAGSVSAQFTATLEQTIRTDYACANAEFKLSDVAAALETDTATLAAAVNAFTAEGAEDTGLFGVPSDDGTGIIPAYNCDGNGSYWFHLDGTLAEWGDSAVYNSLIFADCEADLFAIPIGHHPVAVTDSVVTLHFLMKFNDHTATFDIAYTILPLPEAPVPASLLASAQNVVGQQTVVVNRTTVQDYTADKISFDAQAVADAFGCAPADLGNYISQILYMQKCDGNQELTDSLSNEYTAGAPGFWMKRTLYPVGHDQVGEESPYLGAYGYADGDDIFAEAFAYDEATNTITANVGQHPGVLKAGDDLFATLYLLFGDKAYQLIVNVKVTEPETQGFEGMEEKGVIDIKLQQPPTTDYSTKSFNVDMAALGTTLGCDASAIQVMALATPDQFWAGQGTANHGGFWFNKAGYVVNWDGDGSNANFFIEPVSDKDFSSCNVGQHAGATHEVGDSCVTDLYYVNGSNYVRVHVNLEIIEKVALSDDDWTLMGTRSFTIQQVANGGHTWSDMAAIIKADDLISLIGTASPELYGEEADSLGIVTKTKEYTMGEKPGFWLTDEGYVTTWGQNSTWGITCLASITGAGADWGFKVMQFPEQGNVGNSFTGKFYLVNPENNNYLCIYLTSRVVEVVQETEQVGETTLVMPITKDGYEADFDWAAVAEALGTDMDALGQGNNMRGATGSAVAIGDGLNFNFNGAVASGDGDFIILYDGNESSIYAQANIPETDEVPEDLKIAVDIFIEYEAKQYVIHAIFCSQSVFDSVEGIKAAKTGKSAVYDLQGRRVKAATKGLYIVDGKKVVVK